MSEKKTNRQRNYVSIVYPESAPENWMDILADQLVPAFVSPLHEHDFNPDSDEPKKAHYHVIIMFDGVKTIQQAQEVFDAIGAIRCEVVKVLRSQARYLCHLDNPDKHQYPVTEVRAFAGADYHSIIGLAIDKYICIGEMIDFCEQNNIISYSQLLKWTRENKFEWFRVLCDSATLVMVQYLKSRKWSVDNGFASDPEEDDLYD